MLAPPPGTAHDSLPSSKEAALQDEQFQLFRRAVAGRFRVERELGRGGMATVFRAEDLKNRRPVALKVLRPDFAAMIGAERFRREIEIAARLQHPHILPLYDSDEAGGFLYYVMPLVEGGTLKDRLQQGPRPSVAEALGVVQQVAQGLAYAHAEGLVHRDIKPANILLSSDHAFVGDFGIARIVRQAMSVSEQLTESGLVIGTPTYMAPEQLRGATAVDGRADQYSLACVLFEMLVGVPPSPTRRGTDALEQSLRKARPELPSRVTQAVLRALAPERDARFDTVDQFARAVTAEPLIHLEQLLPRFLRRAGPVARWTTWLLLAAVVTAAGYALRPKPRLPLVADRFVVLPLSSDEAVTGEHADQLLADALARWKGFELVDRLRVQDRLNRIGGDRQAGSTGRQVAREFGAGRFIRGALSAFGDSARIEATLYDTDLGSQIGGTRVIRVAQSLAGADAPFAALADSLLFEGVPPDNGPEGAGTASLPARHHYDEGQRALEGWRLEAADSEFRAAVGHDPGYPAANLWLALVRLWQHREPALWLPAAERALAASVGLQARESAMGHAAIAMGTDSIGEACPRWRRLTRGEPRLFPAWYGLSDCLRGDSIVIRDPRSPSGWRFRSSYHEAQRAYLNALRLLPSVLAAPGNDVGTLSGHLLYLSDHRHRKGQAMPPDSTSFMAAPGWAGDSLIFIPYPRSPAMEVSSPRAPRQDEAIRRQRLLLDTLVLTWVTEAPRSVEARLALIEAMSLSIDRAAIDSARGARALVQDDTDLVRVMDAQLRTLVQFGTPDRLDLLHEARALADTVLGTASLRDAATPEVVTALASLTGRGTLAAAAARRSAARPEWDLPKPLVEAAPGLLIYAAMGGPADSVRRLWKLTHDAIGQLRPDWQLERAMEDLARPATMAFPAETLPSLFELRGMGDWLLNLQAAAADGDRTAIRHWADSTSPQVGSGLWTFDTVWPIVRLLLLAGDTAGAVARLDHSLSGIRFRTFSSFGDPVEAATMVRTMMVQAEVSHRLQQPAEARRWARAVLALWDGADRSFEPELERMRALAR